MDTFFSPTCFNRLRIIATQVLFQIPITKSPKAVYEIGAQSEEAGGWAKQKHRVPKVINRTLIAYF